MYNHVDVEAQLVLASLIVEGFMLIGSVKADLRPDGGNAVGPPGEADRVLQIDIFYAGLWPAASSKYSFRMLR
jgi:hypothetical protein